MDLAIGEMTAYVNEPRQPPIAFDHTAASLLSDAQTLRTTTSELIDNIVATVAPEEATFANTIAPFAQDENRRSTKDLVIQFVGTQDTRAEIREAALAASKVLADGRLEILHRHDFLRLVKAVREKVTHPDTQASVAEELDHEDLLYVHKLFARFEENGATLPTEEARKHYAELRRRIADACRLASTNNNATAGRWLSATDLHGVPERYLTRMKSKTDEDDPGVPLYFVTSKEPDVNAIMTHASSEQTRRNVYFMQQNRNPQNAPLYREIFLLRDEAARLLGYADHATFKTKSKMMKTPQAVDQFLNMLVQQTSETYGKDLQVLQQRKRNDPRAEQPETFYIWDRQYYQEEGRARGTTESVDIVPEYLAAERVLDGMLEICQDLFQIKVIPTAAQTWFTAVRAFSVWRSNGLDFMGYLYADLYTREGKYAHFSHFLLDPGYTTHSGLRHYPSSVCVSNFAPPLPGMPTLLNFSDAMRLAAQIGHSMHNLLSETRYACFHGPRVDKDFLKAQSDLFKRIFSLPSSIRKIARHYSYLSDAYLQVWRDSTTDAVSRPPEKMPEELVSEVLQSRETDGILSMRLTLARSIFDMRVHSPSSHAALEQTDLAKLFNDGRRDITGFAGSREYDGSESLGFSTFRMIIGSQDAGYYCQLMCQVHALDMFETVFQSGQLDDESFRQTGQRYQQIILRPGGTRDELEMLRELLGREPSSASFCKVYGVEI